MDNENGNLVETVMRWFDNTITWLFPRLLIAGTPWETPWNEKEKQTFLLVARLIFPIMAIAAIAHFYFYDLPMGLSPIEHWFTFRWTMALIGLATFAIYVSPITKISLYKVPAIITLWGLCFSQALTYYWYGHEAWVFAFLWVIGTAMALRMSALNSVIYALVTIATQVLAAC